MTKFNTKDKVRVIKGVHEGAEGVVTDPAWQVSQSDWPRVEILQADNTYCYADEDDMERSEDPYEYAIQRVSKDGQEEARIVGSFWNDRKEVNESLLNLTSETVEYKLVKRRKAGEIEDA